MQHATLNVASGRSMGRGRATKLLTATLSSSRSTNSLPHLPAPLLVCKDSITSLVRIAMLYNKAHLLLLLPYAGSGPP